MLRTLTELTRDGAIPRVTVYVDSPRAIAAIALNVPRRLSIIVSASGMASGGRGRASPDEQAEARNAVVLTGYQAVGTAGLRLAEGATELKLYGCYVPVRATVAP